MHTVPTGRSSEIVEVADVEGCVHCAAPIDHAGRSWRQCGCAGSHGHRTYFCAECRGWTFDPPCSKYTQLDSDGLGLGAAKRVLQNGPTAAYGE